MTIELGRIGIWRRDPCFRACTVDERPSGRYRRPLSRMIEHLGRTPGSGVDGPAWPADARRAPREDVRR